MYVKGSVHGIDVNFTIDTGATRTLVALRVFRQIPENQRPALVKKNNSRCLMGANGSKIPSMGQAVFDVYLGSLYLPMEMTVADIQDEVLLGADVLQKGEHGPADLILSQDLMLLNGVKIPVDQTGVPPKERRVYSSDHYVIPGMSEVIVDAFVDRGETWKDYKDECLLIEASQNFTERYPLMMAPCIVDATRRVAVGVRIMNPFADAVSINQDTVLGLCSNVEDLETIFEAEDSGGDSNLNMTRRIQIDKTLATDIQPVSAAKDSYIPSHLQELYDDTTQNLEASEKSVVQGVLAHFKDVFSQDEFDLGCTHVIEHSIPTGDAKPIKQTSQKTSYSFCWGGQESS